MTVQSAVDPPFILAFIIDKIYNLIEFTFGTIFNRRGGKVHA